MLIVDLFAGPGGWSEGLRMLSPELHAAELGIEWDAAACATREAAGHRTEQADVATYPIETLTDVVGIIASPPCQDFSLAGKRAGIDGERGQLITEVIRWVDTLRPEWFACEQVPPALPIWRDYADHFTAQGYSTWCGVLNAADYGVPQTRRRAILIGSRVRHVGPPDPTHDEHPAPSLFGEELAPWVTMSCGLGWIEADGWITERPATTIVGSFCPDIVAGPGVDLTRPRQEREGAVRITQRDALVLQSFPADYPVQGSKSKQFEQIGNAVPPLLAAHVLSVVTGVPFTIQRKDAA